MIQAKSIQPYASICLSTELEFGSLPSLTEALRRLVVSERCFVFPERKLFGTSEALSLAQRDSIRATLHLGQKTRPGDTGEGKVCSSTSEIDQRVIVGNNRGGGVVLERAARM